MTTRLIGTCPICERQQKVTPAGAMVHHGFRRPGRGHIIGDCFGVGYKAYELSTAGCQAYKVHLAEWRQLEERYLERLKDRPETISTEPNFRGQIATYHRDSPDREMRLYYERTLENAIRGVQYTIQELERSDIRMSRLIQAWAPAPLVEIDEEGLTPAKREERVARKAEKDTKRAEKDAKRQAHRAKVNERLARKSIELLFFYNEFERLARQPPSAARDAYARDLIFEMSKKKYNIRYPYALWMGPDDGTGGHIPGPWGDRVVELASHTLVDLGVGKQQEHRRGAFWADPIPVYKSSGNKIRVPELDRPAEEVLEDIAHMPKPS